MANQGAKKLREQNQQHMQSLLRLINFSNAVHLVAGFLVFHSSVTWKNWMGLIFTPISFVIPYKQLANMASPVYDGTRRTC